MKYGSFPDNCDLTEWLKAMALSLGINYQTAQELLQLMATNSTFSLGNMPKQQQYFESLTENLEISPQQDQSLESISSSPLASQTTQDCLPKKRVIFGGFGTNGFDSSAYAMDYLYDLLGNNDQYEFLELIGQSNTDIDAFTQDLETIVAENAKQGYLSIYIHFGLNETPFVCLENSASDNSNLIPSLISVEYIKPFLTTTEQYSYSTPNTAQFTQHNYNHFYHKTLTITSGLALLVTLPNLLNLPHKQLSYFLSDFSKALQ